MKNLLQLIKSTQAIYKKTPLDTALQDVKTKLEALSAAKDQSNAGMIMAVASSMQHSKLSQLIFNILLNCFHYQNGEMNEETIRASYDIAEAIPEALPYFNAVELFVAQTKLQRAEQALHASEQHNAALQNTYQDAVQKINEFQQRHVTLENAFHDAMHYKTLSYKSASQLDLTQQLKQQYQQLLDSLANEDNHFLHLSGVEIDAWTKTFVNYEAIKSDVFLAKKNSQRALNEVKRRTQLSDKFRTDLNQLQEKIKSMLAQSATEKEATKQLVEKTIVADTHATLRAEAFHYQQVTQALTESLQKLEELHEKVRKKLDIFNQQTNSASILVAEQQQLITDEMQRLQHAQATPSTLTGTLSPLSLSVGSTCSEAKTVPPQIIIPDEENLSSSLESTPVHATPSNAAAGKAPGLPRSVSHCAQGSMTYTGVKQHTHFSSRSTEYRVRRFHKGGSDPTSGATSTASSPLSSLTRK